MMTRFCRYLEKVFAWSARLAGLHDARPQPQIPTAAIFLSILMMFATRLRSLNALEGELRMPVRWEKIVGRDKPSADRLGQVGALLDPEQLRDLLSGINHKLRRNKALDENPWPLRFVALDGHEFFSSKKRCCAQCCQRQLKVGQQEVTEYYHRGVVAHLIGLGLPIVLDIEMIRPGEGEIVAARRLLERLLARYARFFDAVEGDALYFESALLEQCRRHGKHLLAVLKDNNPALLADAKAVLDGPPDLERRGGKDGQDLIRYWDQEEFSSGASPTPVRVVRTQETRRWRERVAGAWVAREQTSNWFWGTSIPQTLMPARQIAQAGHERWSIENRIFGTLGAHWGLDHCFHHDPAAILNFILILFIAHTLLASFHRLNMKEPLRGRLTLIAVATQILLGVPGVSARQIGWLDGRGHPP